MPIFGHKTQDFLAFLALGICSNKAVVVSFCLFYFPSFCVCVNMFSILLGIFYGAELLSYMVTLAEGNGNPLQYSCLENSRSLVAFGLQRVGHDWATEHVLALCLTFGELRNCFPKSPCHFEFPTAMYEDSKMFIFSSLSFLCLKSQPS